MYCRINIQSQQKYIWAKKDRKLQKHIFVLFFLRTLNISPLKEINDMMNAGICQLISLFCYILNSNIGLCKGFGSGVQGLPFKKRIIAVNDDNDGISVFQAS